MDFKILQEDNKEKFTWIQEPFKAKVYLNLLLQKKKDLLSCLATIHWNKIWHRTEFWISVWKKKKEKSEYPLLSNNRLLLPLATLWFCDVISLRSWVLGGLFDKKNKTTSTVPNERLTGKEGGVSNYIPRFKKVCRDQQAHPFH